MHEIVKIKNFKDFKHLIFLSMNWIIGFEAKDFPGRNLILDSHWERWYIMRFPIRF